MISNLCEMAQVEAGFIGVQPMQISRHWRLNSQRYRLQGVRMINGEVRLQARPCVEQREIAKPVQERVPVAIGR
jgi:hypothetical protein